MDVNAAITWSNLDKLSANVIKSISVLPSGECFLTSLEASLPTLPHSESDVNFLLRLYGFTHYI